MSDSRHLIAAKRLAMINHAEKNHGITGAAGRRDTSQVPCVGLGTSLHNIVAPRQLLRSCVRPNLVAAGLSKRSLKTPATKRRDSRLHVNQGWRGSVVHRALRIQDPFPACG